MEGEGPISFLFQKDAPLETEKGRLLGCQIWKQGNQSGGCDTRQVRRESSANSQWQKKKGAGVTADTGLHTVGRRKKVGSWLMIARYRLQ